MNIYQNNIDIVKGFFKKPIVLAAALISLISGLFGIAQNIINAINGTTDVTFSSLANFSDIDLSSLSSGNDYTWITLGMNIFLIAVSLLASVSILMLYITSRSNDSTLTPAATLYRVVSIIQMVISGLLSVLLLLCYFLFFIFLFSPRLFFVPILLTPVILISAAYLILLGLSRMIFAGSIRKSVTSVYLKKGGAKLYGIILIISAAFELFTLLYMLLNAGELNITGILSMAVTTADSLLMGIMALMYSSYINGFIKGFANTVPGSGDSVENAYAEPLPYNGVDPVQPPHEYRSYEFTVQAGPVNGYAENNEPVNIRAVFCTNCGKQLNPEDYFCNNCGTPVKRPKQ